MYKLNLILGISIESLGINLYNYIYLTKLKEKTEELKTEFIYSMLIIKKDINSVKNNIIEVETFITNADFIFNNLITDINQ